MADRPPAPPPPVVPKLWHVAAGAVAFAILNTLFPRVGRYTFWASRLSPRGMALYLAWRVAFQWSLVEYAQPWAARKSAEFEVRRNEIASQLAAELGRQPSEDEIARALNDHL